MPTAPPTFHPIHGLQRKGQHAREQRQRYDQARDQSYRKAYKTAQWKAYRALHMATHPLCERCERDGYVNDGKGHLIADHTLPHKGDMRLFYLPGNIQTLCARHDDAKRAKENGIAPCGAGHGQWVAIIDGSAICRDCGRAA